MSELKQITQELPTFSSVPDRDDSGTFEERVMEFLRFLQKFAPQLITWTGQTNALATQINTDSTAAQTAAAGLLGMQDALSQQTQTVWDSEASYSYPQLAVGSNAVTYRCRGTNVVGVDPTTDGGINWVALGTIGGGGNWIELDTVDLSGLTIVEIDLPYGIWGGWEYMLLNTTSIVPATTESLRLQFLHNSVAISYLNFRYSSSSYYCSLDTAATSDSRSIYNTSMSSVNVHISPTNINLHLGAVGSNALVPFEATDIDALKLSLFNGGSFSSGTLKLYGVQHG